MTRLDDPKLVLRELLEAEWGTGGIDGGMTVPDFSTGWHNQGVTVPQVTAGPDEESPVGGGNTGMTGMKGDGSGPVSDMDGTVNVNCWADNDEVASDENPKDVAREYAVEVREIVKTHYLVADYTFPAAADVTADNYRHIWPAPHLFRPDPEADPVNFRYQVTVGYQYQDE